MISGIFGILNEIFTAMITIKDFNSENSGFLKKAQAIRKEVFVQEQGVPLEIEMDNKDGEARHYLAFIGEKAIGTARWRNTKDGKKIERIAVLRAYRKNGVASAIVNKILSEHKPEGNPVFLNGQVHALKFYQNLGFAKSGNIFKEADIDHYRMVYKSSNV